MKCRFVKETAPPGQAWYELERGTLIRAQKTGEPEKLLRASPDQLQAVLDRAALQFHDPLRPRTGPIPDACFPSSLTSRRKYSRPT